MATYFRIWLALEGAKVPGVPPVDVQVHGKKCDDPSWHFPEGKRLTINGVIIEPAEGRSLGYTDNPEDATSGELFHPFADNGQWYVRELRPGEFFIIDMRNMQIELH